MQKAMVVQEDSLPGGQTQPRRVAVDDQAQGGQMYFGRRREPGEGVLAQLQAPPAARKLFQHGRESSVRSAEECGPLRCKGLQRSWVERGQLREDGPAVHQQTLPARVARPCARKEKETRRSRLLRGFGVQAEAAAPEAGEAHPTCVAARVANDGQPVGVGITMRP